MRNRLDLLGDGIENPWNAKTMIDIAAAFETSCFFRDRKQLSETFSAEHGTLSALQFVACEQISQSYPSILALENLDNANDLFGFKLPAAERAVLIAGNERFGISHDMQRLANHVVQIPMFGSTLNTINVAAACGVALYYLNLGGGGKTQIRSHPERRRPELLFMGPTDHVELGSAIRSAGAFGWNRLFLEDRNAIWFGCDRITRSEGRGAARRARNTIRLVPVLTSNKYAFRDVVVVSTKQGTAITKANLSIGPQQLLIIPDESQIDMAGEDWSRFGANVQFVRVDIPAADYVYHYRLIASIALAETARQVGQRPGARLVRPARQRPVYESSLANFAAEAGDEVLLADLQDF